MLGSEFFKLVLGFDIGIIKLGDSVIRQLCWN